MSKWSNGWMKIAPVSSLNRFAATSASSTVLPASSTVAPYALVAATFGSGAPVGMKTVAEQPSSRAASATPCAWLPALAATTPRARSSLESRAIRTYAPRILNDPARCRFSHLSQAGPLTFAASGRHSSRGVTRTTSVRSSRAARTSSRLTSLVASAIARSCHPVSGTGWAHLPTGRTLVLGQRRGGRDDGSHSRPRQGGSSARPAVLLARQYPGDAAVAPERVLRHDPPRPSPACLCAVRERARVLPVRTGSGTHAPGRRRPRDREGPRAGAVQGAARRRAAHQRGRLPPAPAPPGPAGVPLDPGGRLRRSHV